MQRRAKRIDYPLIVNAVAQYIDEHYDDEITASDLASFAHISEFHFCRVFQAVTGDTPGEFLQKHRLHQAYKLIKSAESKTVIDIALAVGYQNHSSFARAFKRYFGVSPSDIAHCNIRWPGRGRARNVEMDRGVKLRPTLVSLPEFRCYGVPVVGYSERSYLKSAEPGFDALVRTLVSGKISVEDKVFVGIPLENAALADHQACRFVAAVKTEMKLSGLGLQEWPFSQGTWAVFDHVGPFSTLWQTWGKIYGSWVIETGASLKNIPAFEVYTPPAGAAESERTTRIHIPLDVDCG